MKFEDVLPTLKEGKKIRRKSWGRVRSFIIIKDDSLVDDYRCNVVIYAYDLKADDWEVVKEKKKVKLRDLTKEQYKTFVDNKCGNQIVGIGCVDCPFYRISCLYGKDNKCWVDNKDLYSDKFLDQEIEIEE